MALYAAIAFGHPGNNSYGTYLAIFEDNTPLHIIRTELSEFSAFGGNTSIVITPDEQFVCFTRMITPYLSRIVRVSDGSYVDVPELVNTNPFGVAFNVVQWSPRRKVFISGLGDYAYDPYNNEVIPLPGPTATAKIPLDGLFYAAEGFSVLAQEEMLIEAMPIGLNVNKEKYAPVVKDLFTGEEIVPPSGMADYIYSGQRPCGWHDDTGISGLIYRNANYRNLYSFNDTYLDWATEQVETRILNTLTGFKHTFTKGTQISFVAATPDGAIFQTSTFFSSKVIFISNNGDVSEVKTELNFGTSPCRNAKVNFIYNNTLFDSKNTVYIGSPPTGLSLVGGAPSTAPLWMYDAGLWGVVAPQIGNIQSTRTFRDPVARDGVFWTNRRYTNELMIYEGKKKK